MIGNKDSGDDRCLRLKENTKGEIYNSIFVNFRDGINLASDGDGGDSVIIRNNTFVNMTNDVVGTPISGNASNGLPYDPEDGANNNEFVGALSGMTNSYWETAAGGPGYWDAVPSSAANALDISSLSEDADKEVIAGADYYDFFDVDYYNGVYMPGSKLWWSAENCALLGGADQLDDSFSSLDKPSDINSDGTTNSLDLNIVLGRYNLDNDQ